MNKKKVKECWQLKNRIGYAVISNDTAKRIELEAELETLSGGVDPWKQSTKNI